MNNETKQPTVSNPVEAVVMLPCPFCGGKALVTNDFIGCGDLTCCVHVFVSEFDKGESGEKERAIIAWNTRAI